MDVSIEQLNHIRSHALNATLSAYGGERAQNASRFA